jgi:hypothetical protein
LLLVHRVIGEKPDKLQGVLPSKPWDNSLMRVLIQDRNTERFYKDGKWTRNRDQAETFGGALEVVQLCVSKKIQGNIVLAFRDPKFDVKIPCG